MRQRLYSSIVFIIVLATFFGCKKSSDSIAVDFTFQVNAFTATFTAVSPDASSFSWDFGDNDTSLQKNPVHRFAHGGLYKVTLTVKGVKSTNSIQKEITIATPTSVKVTGVKLISYPLTNGNLPWDPNDGPDFYCRIFPDNGGMILQTSIVNNVIPSMLPLTLTVTQPLEITNFKDKYYLFLYDDDSPAAPQTRGGYLFDFSYFAALGYPSAARLQYQDDPLIAELTLEWK